mgnify:CR=1 FL=1
MRSMLPDREIRVRTLRIPTAHGSIPARAAHQRGDLYVEFNTAAEKNGVRRCWIDLPK